MASWLWRGCWAVLARRSFYKAVVLHVATQGSNMMKRGAALLHQASIDRWAAQQYMLKFGTTWTFKDWRGQIISIEILQNVHVDVLRTLTVQKHFSFDPLDTQKLCVTLSIVRAATRSSLWFLLFMLKRALLSKLIFLAWLDTPR